MTAPAGALSALAVLALAACDGGQAFDWPVAHDGAPLVVADTFGPRLQGGVYDFHRGLDILADFGEPIHAIKAGEVLVAGDDPDYQPDTVVVMHCADAVAPATMAQCVDAYYTHYSHLSSIQVVTGQPIERGARVGLSGRGESGIPQVHFEVRQGGKTRADAVHPLRVLPYVDRGPPGVSVVSQDFSDPTRIAVTVAASAAADELDIARVEVELRARADDALLDSQIFDMEEWGRTYGATADIPDQGEVSVEPIDFNPDQPENVVHFHFYGLATDAPRAEVRVVARVTDVMDNSAQVED